MKNEQSIGVQAARGQKKAPTQASAPGGKLPPASSSVPHREQMAKVPTRPSAPGGTLPPASSSVPHREQMAKVPIRPSISAGASVAHSTPSSGAGVAPQKASAKPRASSSQREQKPLPPAGHATRTQAKDEFEVVRAPVMMTGDRHSPKPGTLFAALYAAQKK